MTLLSLALRTAVSIALLVSSLWALLAYVPFTYQQVHKGGLVPALNAFGRAFPQVFWIALLAVAVIFCLEPIPPRPHHRGAMRRRAFFWYLHVPLAIFFTAHPVFGAMENGASSYVWAFVMFEPLLFLTAIAMMDNWPAIQWGPKPAYGQPPLFIPACLSAIFLSLVYSGLANWRAAQTWTPLQRTLAALSSLTAHLLVFAVLFVALNLLTVVAGWFRNSQRTLFLFCHALGAWVIFYLLTTLVFPSISFSGSAAEAYSAAFGVALSAFAAGISILLRQSRPAPVENGFDLALWVRTPRNLRAHRWWRVAAEAVLLAVVAILFALGSYRNDWNHLFQKLSALLIWVAAFRIFYAMSRGGVARGFPPLVNSRTGRFLVLALAILPAQRVLEAGERSLWKTTGSQESFSRFLDTYAGFDPSFKLVHDSMATVVVDTSFYQFLARNTNLPRSAHVEPVDIKLADNAAPLTEKPPNIFIFVVDSLRKDYLSPYNSRVDFTPNIDRFAADSVVMRNAFTRYGGTGLSEPSIWVGGVMIHKQYVVPFAPMNSLQKLLEAHDYQAFVTRDSILQTVVTPWPKLTELDANHETMDLDFCQSVSELSSKLGAARQGPIFAYSQPQNIHISVISRQGQNSIDNGDYHGFYAPYASRLRRIDGCLGQFIQTLKTQGLYDNSVIVLTADHGDSLGEQGRWGHAYTIFPEIVRVPLIVHLPLAWRKYQWDPDALAFNSDIAPSLYYLLGHRPILNSELLGRPLFAERREELNAYKHENYLVASSYAAVYGILSDEGRFLFTADGVNLKESWFDLSESQPLARPVTSSMKVRFEKMIHEKISQISQQYKFPPQ